jgi:electron transport complex protein RnfB
MIILSVLFASLAAILTYSRQYFALNSDTVVDKIEALLPQIQCAQCGFPGCKPYAQAIAEGRAEINLCPPGGEETIIQLAHLLNTEIKSLAPQLVTMEAQKAFIIEEDCIGCGKCIPPCPVDAIIGAPKFMHTIIENECTGCELCIAPCPMNCIVMIPVKDSCIF